MDIMMPEMDGYEAMKKKLREKIGCRTRKISHFLSQKTTFWGNFWNPHIFGPKARFFYFFLTFLKKTNNTSFVGRRRRPENFCTFFFLAAEGGPILFFIFFLPLLQYKRFLQGKKLVLSRKIILRRKTIFDPPPGGRGFSDLDTLGHYTCPCPQRVGDAFLQ